MEEPRLNTADRVTRLSLQFRPVREAGEPP
jgi:hypothetical protein